MTLDILSFIDNKGGNAEEIRESQRKRGHSVELVDEIIQMYTDWVKSAFISFLGGLWLGNGACCILRINATAES
jgi:hypothetical protein